MKTFKAGIAITLLASLMLPFVITKGLCADDAKKVSSPIKEHLDKIAIEREAILADGRKLEEAKKTGDKIKIEQVKKETDQDIKNRKAAIKALYKDMDKKWTGNSGNNLKPKRP